MASRGDQEAARNPSVPAAAVHLTPGTFPPQRVAIHVADRDSSSPGASRFRVSALALLAGALLAAAGAPLHVHAQSAPPEAASVGPSAAPVGGLGLTIGYGRVRSGGGLLGSSGLVGHSFVVARGTWFTRALLFQSEVHYHELRRASVPECVAPCPTLETRRRTATVGVALEWHHDRTRLHAYPLAGVGIAYSRSTGASSDLGIASHLGAGVSVPVRGGWPAFSLELRGHRVPTGGRLAWHVPLSLGLRF